MLVLLVTLAANAQVLTGSYNALVGNASPTSTNGQFLIQTTSANSDPYIHMFSTANTNGGGGSINLIAGYNANSAASSYTFQRRDPAVGWLKQMEILQSGQVRIGQLTPRNHPDYRLSVEGKLVSQSLFVTNPNNWADFVFAPAYRLRPLSEVAAYISQNQHLPDVPAAEEVLRDGYDLNQMDARLLQKVEELTLYVLQLEQKMKALEEKAAGSSATR